MSIPITKVVVGPEEEKLVLEVLRSGQLAQGPMVERLEAGFASLVGVKHAVAVSSGTTALVASLQALDLSPGDEVITSPLTFVATLNAILEAGAVARFADIGDDFNVDPASVEALVGPRTRALLPVHLYGLPAAMDRIGDIAARHGLAVIEDAAQAVGASFAGAPAGSFGIGCFSLYATKNIMTGEGGVITTDDDQLATALRTARNQGMRARYEYLMAGHNYRMTDLQAAVGVAQLERLADITETRRANAGALTAGLAGAVGIVPPEVPHGRTHVFHQYTVRVTPEAGITRDQLSEAIGRRGVGSGVYYPRAVFDYDVYRSHPDVMLDPVPRAERAAAEVLSLPVHPGLSITDLRTIADAVRGSLPAG
jgi:dTDP-4-amino-4,6-dideoxygalactose transaminase